MVNGMVNARELNALRQREDFWKTYFLLDVREEAEFSYGFIPGAVNIPSSGLAGRLSEVPKEKTIILYCSKGITSKEAAVVLQENGYRVAQLHGGYTAWLVAVIEEEENARAGSPFLSASERQGGAEQRNGFQSGHGPQDGLGVEHGAACGETICERVELSIRKKFHKQLFSNFAKAINTYDLLQPGDKVAVCISGGKDSMLLAKLFQELKRHRKFDFELVFLAMDPGYNELNRKLIEKNARDLEIPLTIFESTIFDTVVEVEKSPCYLCARMRRGSLYSRAKAMGCNKIALGHHYDDVIETILMGMLYGGQVQTMMPKLHSTNFEGMELIRPMYLVREEDIRHWRDYNGLHFLQCACRFTEENDAIRADGTSESKRMEVKHLIRRLKETNPYVEANIFKSVENVNLSTVIAYKKDGVVHNFLETYGETGGGPDGGEG